MPEPINSKTWKTRNGRKILVHEMSDTHIANTIAMLRRHYKLISIREDLDFALLSSLQGEMAQYAVEGDLTSLADQAFTVAMWISVFTTEQRRRRGEL
jgi:hypothetical protein